jgi:hypothetical protein
MIGDLFVKISFTAQKNSKTPPIVSIEMVCGDDPVIKNIRKAIQNESKVVKRKNAYKTSRSH